MFNTYTEAEASIIFSNFATYAVAPTMALNNTIISLILNLTSIIIHFMLSLIYLVCIIVINVKLS